MSKNKAVDRLLNNDLVNRTTDLVPTQFDELLAKALLSANNAEPMVRNEGFLNAGYFYTAATPLGHRLHVCTRTAVGIVVRSKKKDPVFACRNAGKKANEVRTEFVELGKASGLSTTIEHDRRCTEDFSRPVHRKGRKLTTKFPGQDQHVFRNIPPGETNLAILAGLTNRGLEGEQLTSEEHAALVERVENHHYLDLFKPDDDVNHLAGLTANQCKLAGLGVDVHNHELKLTPGACVRACCEHADRCKFSHQCTRAHAWITCPHVPQALENLNARLAEHAANPEQPPQIVAEAALYTTVEQVNFRFAELMFKAGAAVHSENLYMPLNALKPEYTNTFTTKSGKLITTNHFKRGEAYVGTLDSWMVDIDVKEEMSDDRYAVVVAVIVKGLIDSGVPWTMIISSGHGVQAFVTIADGHARRLTKERWSRILNRIQVKLAENKAIAPRIDPVCRDAARLCKLPLTVVDDHGDPTGRRLSSVIAVGKPVDLRILTDALAGVRNDVQVTTGGKIVSTARAQRVAARSLRQVLASAGVDVSNGKPGAKTTTAKAKAPRGKGQPACANTGWGAPTPAIRAEVHDRLNLDKLTPLQRLVVRGDADGVRRLTGLGASEPAVVNNDQFERMVQQCILPILDLEDAPIGRAISDPWYTDATPSLVIGTRDGKTVFLNHAYRTVCNPMQYLEVFMHTNRAGVRAFLMDVLNVRLKVRSAVLVASEGAHAVPGQGLTVEGILRQADDPLPTEYTADKSWFLRTLVATATRKPVAVQTTCTPLDPIMLSPAEIAELDNPLMVHPQLYGEHLNSLCTQLAALYADLKSQDALGLLAQPENERAFWAIVGALIFAARHPLLQRTPMKTLCDGMHMATEGVIKLMHWALFGEELDQARLQRVLRYLIAGGLIIREARGAYCPLRLTRKVAGHVLMNILTTPDLTDPDVFDRVAEGMRGASTVHAGFSANRWDYTFVRSHFDVYIPTQAERHALDEDTFTRLAVVHARGAVREETR